MHPPLLLLFNVPRLSLLSPFPFSREYLTSRLTIPCYFDSREIMQSLLQSIFFKINIYKKKKVLLFRWFLLYAYSILLKIKTLSIFYYIWTNCYYSSINTIKFNLNCFKEVFYSTVKVTITLFMIILTIYQKNHQDGRVDQWL